jgi:ribosomal-protein-alanine acetyltransferase
LHTSISTFAIVTIRHATFEDVASIIAMERSCPTAAHWDEHRYAELFHSHGASQRLALVAIAPSAISTRGGGSNSIREVIGFLIARHVASEWELENIAVARAFQRQGVAKRLLDALFDQALQTGSESIYLEVRESNTAARGLYEKTGFDPTGRRKAYYSNPHEDAVLYRKTLI